MSVRKAMSIRRCMLIGAVSLATAMKVTPNSIPTIAEVKEEIAERAVRAHEENTKAQAALRSLLSVHAGTDPATDPAIFDEQKEALERAVAASKELETATDAVEAFDSENPENKIEARAHELTVTPEIGYDPSKEVADYFNAYYADDESKSPNSEEPLVLSEGTAFNRTPLARPDFRPPPLSTDETDDEDFFSVVSDDNELTSSDETDETDDAGDTGKAPNRRVAARRSIGFLGSAGSLGRKMIGTALTLVAALPLGGKMMNADASAIAVEPHYGLGHFDRGQNATNITGITLPYARSDIAYDRTSLPGMKNLGHNANHVTGITLPYDRFGIEKVRHDGTNVTGVARHSGNV